MHQEKAFISHLVATAVSYISVLFPGRLVRLQVTDGFAIVTPIDVETGEDQGLDGLDVLVSSILESKDAKHEIKTLKLGDYRPKLFKCRLCALRRLVLIDVLCFWVFGYVFGVSLRKASEFGTAPVDPSRTGVMIAEMLRERCRLEEVVARDRVLRGAQQLLCKYRIGSSV